MQYHFDGFRPGDPAIAPERPAGGGAGPAGDRVDVLIIGCGPAGLTLAAQLARFDDITTRIVERKDGPLQMGQADGIACRSMEMFAAFGFAEKVLKESYWVNETVFWRPAPDGALQRADRIQDVADDLSEMPHVILSQARVHDFYLELMRNSPHRMVPDYGRGLVAVHRDDDPSHPVRAQFEDGSALRARYVVGCDGARSTVRKAMGQALRGEAARQLWGVMDVLAVTDFPDVRLKCAIQSADQGSILIIPREGGTLIRLYIELGALEGDARASDREVSPALLEARAQAILAPYRFDVRDVVWWSAYEIGQRVCDGFDDRAEGIAPRLFIAGDACHTHSPKAGQGMNVSMADAFNLGWKLAAVLRGQSAPGLLRSYSDERRAKAQELIDFDRDMARLFSARTGDAREAAQFQAYFQKHGRYTAGVETQYAESDIVADDRYQHLARGQVVGKRFHAGPVIRLADARPMSLSGVLLADGRWRVIVFAPAEGVAAIDRFCASVAPVLRSFTPPGADPDSVIDLRAVFQQGHRDLALDAMPRLLLPQKGRFGLTDYEKIFCPDLVRGPDLFDLRGIDREAGAVILVRPDQFVADVLPLDQTVRLQERLGRVLLAPAAG